MKLMLQLPCSWSCSWIEGDSNLHEHEDADVASHNGLPQHCHAAAWMTAFHVYLFQTSNFKLEDQRGIPFKTPQV
jgi:hypothetical protein